MVVLVKYLILRKFKISVQRPLKDKSNSEYLVEALNTIVSRNSKFQYNAPFLNYPHSKMNKMAESEGVCIVFRPVFKFEKKTS